MCILCSFKCEGQVDDKRHDEQQGQQGSHCNGLNKAHGEKTGKEETDLRLT